MAAVIADTGPLVAFLDRRESAHAWVRSQFAQLREPLLTCEPVLAETAYLLRSRGLEPARFFQLFHRNLVKVQFSWAADWINLESLMTTYQNVPMSLADACLVRMSEQIARSTVFTLDADFLIYRQYGRSRIPLLAPYAVSS